MKLMLSSPGENIQLQLRFLSLSYTNDATDKHTEFSLCPHSKTAADRVVFVCMSSLKAVANVKYACRLLRLHESPITHSPCSHQHLSCV